MTKPAKRKRSESEDAGERVVLSEVMLRSGALAYAEVAKLDPSDLRWRRCWRALRLAATGVVAAIQEAACCRRKGIHRRGRWRRADPQLRQRFDACAARRPLSDPGEAPTPGNAR
ncbi:MAG TPA: hypothetical protein VFA20_24535 [Myxococcaceae bacterium]|nr:hypothetical protein [Myxococcaceae bacterium]